ncbi:flagellar brake protein YcgR [Candidatus Gastranaerophilus sp. (ex Termes propinquus)]|nr:flagellar brake protein YcgR [Candidatus Gastranaerophilus sp. (ex Termes propinquus)]
MKELIEKSKDFKIIPQNFQSATVFEVKNIAEDNFVVELPLASESELGDYASSAEVEIFGSCEGGLVYFVTEILNKDGKTLTVKMPESHRSIQRREYSRVDFSGRVEFDNKDMTVVSKDISAGGLRVLVDAMLEIGKEYPVCVTLTNNMSISAGLQPIRISETDKKTESGAPLFMVSGRFKSIESVDRIALVQYSFKSLMEAKNRR